MTDVIPDLALVRQLALSQGMSVFDVLQGQGLDLAAASGALARGTGIQQFALAELDDMTPEFSAINYDECLQRQCVALVDGADQLWFVMSDPTASELITWASYRIVAEFQLAFCHPQELKALLTRLESHQEALNQLIRLERQSLNDESQEISLASIAQDESQVIRLVNSTLYNAHKSGASDIHLENGARGLVIKYRLDGVLSRIRHLPDSAIAEQVVSRLKVMAELDIGEKRIPQDGRFAITMAGREIDFRVSIMPGLFGEDAVLRILDKQHLTTEIATLTLDSLGIDPETRAIMRRLAQQPYGMLLVTGPTGSGKTTTLYATLSEINHGDDKIITIEDPVEYQLQGVLQIPVNERKGLTFARGLRSILRHDPDRILVGEIRDQETAEIAVQAALTGHLVFTTVHANNVFDVLGRFHHMGLDPYSFVTALNGIVAQRLVRLICPDCAKDVDPDDTLLKDSGLSRAEAAHYHFRQGGGCANCRGTGYRGRRALAEVLVLDDEMREAILRNTPLPELKRRAAGLGMIFMRQQAMAAVRAGETTLQEINRVTFVE